MFKASITLAALIAAVSIASAPVFARGGGGGGGQHASPPANKAAATPSKNSGTTSKIFTNSAKGAHYKQVIIH
jgi:hypothetical protein